MSEDAKTRIKRARSKLILSEPFYAVLSLRLQVMEDKGCPTAWTDGSKFGYNPAFIGALTDAEIIGVWVHEVLHCAMSHMSRRGTRNPSKWNIAGDFAINSIIRQKFTLPKGCLFDPLFSGKSAEAIYDMLPDDPHQGQGQGQGQGQEGQGQGRDPGGCGEVRDAESPSEATNEWKVATAQAVAAARGIGNLPGDLAVAIDKIIRNPLPWQELLRRFVDTAAKNDYDWTPPDRRFITQDIYLPDLSGEELRNIVVAVDSSGSVSDNDLARFGGEVETILQQFRTMLTVIYCDENIQKVEEFTSDDCPIKWEPLGRGGTRVQPVFERIAKLTEPPACLIYLTDMEICDFPESDPGYPVLWVQVRDSSYAERCKIGEIIKMSD